jgi:hypothetical protein
VTSVRIGAQRVADRNGTHEPGDEVDNASVELVALATPDPKTGKPTLDPDSGAPYATLIGLAAAPAKPTPPPDDTEKAG